MKAKNVYVCQSCGTEVANWVGQCPKCSEWNSFEEVSKPDTKLGKSHKNSTALSQELKSLALVKPEAHARTITGIFEFDRVLGGGFVPGQVVLLAGDPGVGKSTLVTQVCKSLPGQKVLYICGEESPSQIKLRLSRMNYLGENIDACQNLEVESIEQIIYSNSENTDKFSFVIVDSIQTIYSSALISSTGSLSQIKECAQRLVTVAKKTGACVILVGHVTKEGEVAGPKVLEHIVDTVLYMQGDNQHSYRILRTSKNRFGPVSEIGIFEMVEGGIEEVKNPAQMFLSESSSSVTGSCVSVAMEGFRPMFFEIQALSVKTSFGYPKRTVSGLSLNRLQVLLAVLEKRCGIVCSQYDIYVSVAGGYKVNENASDLAICLAVASAIADKPIKANTLAFGEVSLSGEVRKVPQFQKRLDEGKRMGYENILANNSGALKDIVRRNLTSI